MNRRTAAAARSTTGWSLVAALPVALAACGGALQPGPGPGVAGTSAPVIAAAPADVTVSTPGTVLNRYAVLASNLVAGSTSLVVDDALSLASPSPLAPGDLLLVMQMQGAVIDSSNTAGYGFVIDRGGAGTYELLRVGGVTGNRIDVDAGCGAVAKSYRVAGRTQVVRVPVVRDLLVSSSGSIVPAAWDGAKGGVLALDVTGDARVDGAIDATGAGFRGGLRDNTSANSGQGDQQYRSPDAADGGEKGESIAGFEGDYDAFFGGRYSRGAAGNGGGGGTAHNGGGGGGANGDSLDGWSGDGVMDPATLGAAAWTLDPAYQLHGNALTHSSGGGRGGYTFSFSDQDALTVPPGDPAWTGNFRRERGGHGGHPLKNVVAGPLFVGGGGGAGDSNNDAGGSGGPGGGLVLLRVAGAIRGAGAIAADGGPGESTRNGGNDGPGGGGAGGTIVAVASTFGGITLHADGGAGGNQSITTLEAEGPGGGGGGGWIAVGGGSPPRHADGGVNGQTDSPSLTEFPANGATMGAPGQPDEIASAIDIPICLGGIPEPAAPQFNVQGSGGCACRVGARARGGAGGGLAAALVIGGSLLSLVCVRRRRAR